MIDEAAIQLRYAALEPVLDERGRRRFAAAEALAAGRGGVTAVSRITGLARSTIARGLAGLTVKSEIDTNIYPVLIASISASLTLMPASSTVINSMAIGTTQSAQSSHHRCDNLSTVP
ncbi:hypothetical protein GGD50_004308 [Rhizobium paranaense]|uniref:Uncharacterized protein n=1 Tax=Rhizobium paranaense TaxID=1650438 RepID=A0A7W9D2V7_9HYPH|nr:hypothetical protein [Rhizobium paranaense]